MANLKDTIVLGNLTVTGKVTASDILNTNGNPNRFETIYANKIVGQGENYTLEIEAIAENGTMKITTGLLEVNGPLQINTIQTKTGSGLEISSDSTLQLNATSNIDLISDGNTLKISGDTVVPDGVVQLGTSQKFFDRAYIDTLNTSTIGSIDNASTLTIGSGTDSLQVNSGTVQFTNSITTPGISYGGTFDLNAEAGTNIKTGLYPSGTANIGGSGAPFSQIYATRYMAGTSGSSATLSSGSNGQILTSGGSSGNSYWKGIYAHNLTIIETDSSGNNRYHCTIITNSSASLSTAPNLYDVSALLYSKGFTSMSGCLAASGVFAGYGKVIGIYGFKGNSSNSNSFGIVYVNSSNQVTNTTVTPPCNIQDVVYTL